MGLLKKYCQRTVASTFAPARAKVQTKGMQKSFRLSSPSNRLLDRF
jgi:hypothetical protein